MGGSTGDESELGDFVAARTAELHRTAYLLTADQDRAERLVEVAVAQLAWHRTDIGQAGAEARRCMARLAATATTPTPATRTAAPTDDADTAIADLSPRQRAVLLLRCLDGHDTRSTARELGLAPSKVTDAEQSASHTVGFEPHDDRLRAALTDFSERATWPDPDVTLSRAEHVQPPRRHSRKRYVAAAAVIALTAAAPIGSQIAHDRWLKTPEGINASHGTHLRPYTQGYELVGVQRVPAGGSTRVKASPREVIAPICSHFTLTSQTTWARVGDRLGHSMQPFPCTNQSASHYYLLGLDQAYTVRAPPKGGDGFLVARYLRIPRERYPVAKGPFDVEHDQTFGSVFRDFGQPVTRGRTVTLRGTNGARSAVVPLPPPAANSDLYLVGVLSPTTTGDYKVTLGGDALLHCDALDDNSAWCREYDKYVYQVRIVQGDLDDNGSAHIAPSAAGRVVRVEARHALGPWKLQIGYVRIPHSG